MRATLRATEDRLFYSDLSAEDADGQTLHAWMSVQGGSVLLHVDDGQARYPVSIDPLIWFQQQKLIASDCSAGVETAEASCTGSGVDCPPPVTVFCESYACGATDCLTSCASPGDCSPGFECVGTECRPLEADGIQEENAETVAEDAGDVATDDHGEVTTDGDGDGATDGGTDTETPQAESGCAAIGVATETINAAA